MTKSIFSQRIPLVPWEHLLVLFDAQYFFDWDNFSMQYSWRPYYEFWILQCWSVWGFPQCWFPGARNKLFQKLIFLKVEHCDTSKEESRDLPCSEELCSWVDFFRINFPHMLDSFLGKELKFKFKWDEYEGSHIWISIFSIFCLLCLLAYFNLVKRGVFDFFSRQTKVSAASCIHQYLK